MLQWIHNYAAISVRPSTYISYEGYVHNHINPILGQIPLQHITPVIIQNFYNQKYESGRTDGRGGLSAKTIRNLHNMRDALNYLLAAAGVEHANFHALRHTFATRAIENGVNVKTLSDILGHSQVQITMDLYCHTSLDLMRDSMNKLAGLF